MGIEPEEIAAWEKELLGDPPSLGEGLKIEKIPSEGQPLTMACPLCKKEKASTEFEWHHRIPGDDKSIIRICRDCHDVLNAHPSGHEDKKERENLPPQSQTQTEKQQEGVDATERLHNKVDYSKGPVTSQVNDECELAYDNLIRGYLIGHPRISYDRAVNWGAASVGCSRQVVAYNYLPKICIMWEEHLEATQDDPRPLQEIRESGRWIVWRREYLAAHPEIREAIEQARALGLRKAGELTPLSETDVQEVRQE
jgi:hypothetical protein